MYERRDQKPGWASAALRRDLKHLRVFTDLEKFGRVLWFQFKSRKPYLLSLNDFLPSSTVLDVKKIEKDTDDLNQIRWALSNVAKVFSIILGDPQDTFEKSLKPVFEALNVLAIQSVPLSWICYLISVGLEVVTTEMREGIPDDSNLKMYRTPGIFQQLLEAEMVEAASRMLPKGDSVSMAVENFVNIQHKEIQWEDPRGKVSSTAGKGSGSGAADKRPSPSDGQPLTNAAKRKARRLRAADPGAGQGNQSGPSGQKTGGQTGNKYGPGSHICPPHLLHLLGCRGTSGHVIFCDMVKTGSSGCSRGRHPTNFKQIKAGEGKIVSIRVC